MFYSFWFLLMTLGLYNIDPLLYGIDSRTYGDCFAEALVVEAEKDKSIVTVHAGMQMEPSIQLFRERFPDKFFDVGMAEQHAVTFAAGLSCGGLKPFCVIPSAFLQRAYDQVSLSSCSTLALNVQLPLRVFRRLTIGSFEFGFLGGA